MRKLFVNNTVLRTNYTQLHQLGGLRERWKLSQRPGSFSSIFIEKKAHL